MFDKTKEYIAHAAEVARAIRRHKWTQVANGIHLDEMRAIACGSYVIGVTRRGQPRFEFTCDNLLPTEGLAAVLNIFAGNLAVPSNYIALFANAYTPLAADTAAGFTATYGELISTTEGYSGSNRILWVDATTTTTAVNNYASPAVFTMVSASLGNITVNGVAMLTAQARAAITGKLISAAKFASTRTFNDTDELDVKYQLSLTSS